jgi:HD-GYP domain-containing protein (c-di-GMP phosphodiesterase class II)
MDVIKIVSTICKIIEIKDPITASHQKRVAEFAKRMAERMNISIDRKITIHVSGLIHDLGMISVPSDIVCKTDNLNDLEFELVKMHPQTGFDLLSDLEFQFPITRIILEHHERLNGSGYPRGLKSNEILLESKVLAVADTIDAMRSHRPYRPALADNFIFKELFSNRDILFDADAVDAALYLLYNART